MHLLPTRLIIDLWWSNFELRLICASGFSGQAFPGIATSIEVGLPILEHGVGKVGLAQELPNILCWVQLWRIGPREQVERFSGAFNAPDLC